MSTTNAKSKHIQKVLPDTGQESSTTPIIGSIISALGAILLFRKNKRSKKSH
ncbi:TPA: LPXTG cell wall anchor domain-containing protein [Staphylococcus aureus]